MKKTFAVTAFVFAASAAFAVPTVNGVLTDSDYTTPVVSNAINSGYGPHGIVSLRTFRDATDLYVGLSGTAEGNGNNFRLVVGRVNTPTGIQSGTALTGGNDGLSPFSGFNRVLAADADLAVRFSGAGGGTSTNGFVSVINYRTGLTEVVGADVFIGNPTNGTAVTQATGFATGVSVAYTPGATYPTEGNAGVEIKIPLAAIGATASDALELFAVQGGGGGANISWSFVPGVLGYNTYDTIDFNALAPTQKITVAGTASIAGDTWKMFD